MLTNARYCPSIYTRVAEIKALRQLPSQAKDLIFPVLRLRPWPNANRLQKAFDRIDEAFPAGRYALDLDRFKHGSNSGKEAATEFDSLFVSQDSYGNYYTLVAEQPFAIPVIRTENSSIPMLEDQWDYIEGIERGCVLYISRVFDQQPEKLIEQIEPYMSENLLIVLDAGWTTDFISTEVWTSPLIQAITDRQPNYTIVSSGSSFPDSFTKIGEEGSISVQERGVYDRLVARHNAANLVYGDWASTRLPADPVPMTNVPRIDLALATRWMCFRAAKGSNDSYTDVADRAVSDALWETMPDIWGADMIKWTAAKLEGSIKSPATATAVRVNLHLYEQAFFNLDGSNQPDDIEYED